MDSRTNRCASSFALSPPRLSLLALLVLATTPTLAQYQVYYWANFENGAMPPDSTPIGTDFARSVRVVDLSREANAPAELRGALAEAQTGGWALKLTSIPEVWISGLAVGPILDRDTLGASGRALYQADFFIPGNDATLPNLAVLATEPLKPFEARPQTFYRFGITNNRVVYFSKVILDQAPAKLYVNDESFSLKVPRPGWHRFAIVFEGSSRIRCFIDGREPSFSPVDEPELRRLQVGILLADQKKEYTCYADNISIQMTSEDAAPPDSPYAESWPRSAPAGAKIGANAAANAQPSRAAGSPASSPPGQGTVSNPAGAGPFVPSIVWLDTVAGWAQCQATKRPMLVLFTAPRIAAGEELDGLFASDPAAREFLKSHVPVRIDVNQLQGGTEAAKFKVFKVPTLVLIDAAGAETGRITYLRGQSWSDLAPHLRSGASPPAPPIYR